MQNKISKIIITFFLVIFGSVFFSAGTVDASCVVTQANFRVGPNPIFQINPNTWYTDTNPPFVYIDIKTAGCVSPNNTFELSITEYDVDEDFNPIDLLPFGSTVDIEGFGPIASLDDNNVDNFDDEPVTVPAGQNDFTIATRAGDDECESVYEPNCRYYIRINGNVLGGVTQFLSTSNLRYNCHNGCDNMNWQYVGIIPYGEMHDNDNGSQQTGVTGPTTPGGPGIVGEEIAINIQNPIGSNNMTLVDFIQRVINFALTIGIPIIAIAIIYSGLLFVTARGNDQQLETAKNAFTYAVIGGALLLGAFIFAKLIKETIESIAMISNYFV